MGSITSHNRVNMWFVPEDDITTLAFDLAACFGATLSLGSDIGSDSNLVSHTTVVLGDDMNFKCSIKDGTNDENWSTEHTPSVLNCKYFREFWLSWGRENMVEVGRGRPYGQPLVQWTSPQTLPPTRVVGITSTSTRLPGYWDFMESQGRLASLRGSSVQ